MKLKIQTIIGVTHEIEIEEDWTIRQVKREIYKSGKVAGAVRILKGQDILPDGSTLVQLNISDGDSVNIIVEPDKQVNIDVTCTWGTFTHEVSTSMLVKDFKLKLIESEQIAFRDDEFNFEAKLSGTEVKLLEDDSLPLHEYGIQNGWKIRVVKPYIFLTLMSHGPSRKVHKKLTKKTTVGELKKMIIKLFCGKNVTDIKLFVTSDEIDFVKVGSNDEMAVGQILSDGQIVYFLEDKSDYGRCWPVIHEGKEIGKVYGNTSQVRTLKLRIQDQFGIPASCATVNLQDLGKNLTINVVQKFDTLDDNNDNLEAELGMSIFLDVVCPLGTFKHEVSTSMSVRDFKKKLIKSRQVGFFYDEFDLEAQIPGTEAKVLEDDSLPLHDYGIENGWKLQVVRPYMFLTLIGPNQYGKVYRKLTKKTTVGQLKTMKMKRFCDRNVTDISLFVTKDDTEFIKVGSQNDISIGKMFSDGDIIYLVEDKWEKRWYVWLEGEEIGKVYGASQDTMHTIKLRIQDQLGVLASDVVVRGENIITTSLALHCHETQKERSVREHLFITLMNQDQSKMEHKKLAKVTTVGELKKTAELFCGKNVTDISLFVTKDDTKYSKIDPNNDISLGQILSHGCTILPIEEKWDFNDQWPIMQAGKEIGKVYGDSSQDTGCILKLRIQDQLGIPASCATVHNVLERVDVQDCEKICGKTISVDVLTFQKDLKQQAVREHLFVTLTNHDQSKMEHKKLSKKASVGELKKMIKELFYNRNVTDISLFYTKDDTKFVKVNSNDDASIGEILSDGYIIYPVEDKLEKRWSVICEEREIGKVYGASKDTTRTIKLRIQDQLGINASEVAVRGENIIITSLALHRHGTQKEQSVQEHLFVTLMNLDQSKMEHKKLAEKTSIGELKKMITELFCDRNATDISLFVTKDDTKYVKVDSNNDTSIGQILSHGCTIYLVEDKMEKHWPVMKEYSEIGKVRGSSQDRVRTLKLRVQDQLGVPASCVTIHRQQRGWCSDRTVLKDSQVIGESITVSVTRK